MPTATLTSKGQVNPAQEDPRSARAAAGRPVELRVRPRWKAGGTRQDRGSLGSRGLLRRRRAKKSLPRSRKGSAAGRPRASASRSSDRARRSATRCPPFLRSSTRQTLQARNQRLSPRNRARAAPYRSCRPQNRPALPPRRRIVPRVPAGTPRSPDTPRRCPSIQAEGNGNSGSTLPYSRLNLRRVEPNQAI